MKFKLTWRLRGRIETNLVFNTKEEVTAALTLFHVLFPTPDHYDYVQLNEEQALNGHVFSYTELRVFEELIKSQNKVLAIKMCRDITKAGLKEAKEFIDGVQDRLPKQPSQGTIPAISLGQIFAQREQEKKKTAEEAERGAWLKKHFPPTSLPENPFYLIPMGETERRLV